jgi:hypothetical protein
MPNPSVKSLTARVNEGLHWRIRAALSGNFSK